MSWLSRLLLLLLALLGGMLLHSTQCGRPLGAVFSQNHLLFLHLASVAISVGVSAWTTFVFGILAFKHLPRRTFGTLQGKLFPAYFQLLTACGAVAVYCFHHLATSKSNLSSSGSSSSSRRVWQDELGFQMTVLLGGLVAVVANLAFLEPKTSSVMRARHRIEDSHPGAPPERLKVAVPEYKALSAKFGMYHGLSSLLNLAAFSASLLHLWFLSTRLSL